MKKAISVLFTMILAAGILATTACQKKEQAATTEKILIGFAQSESNDTWLSYLHDAFANYFADKPEYEIVWSDGQNDVTRQQDNVNAMISRGIKGLVIIPVDTSAATPITRAAQEAGIPLVYVNRNPFTGTTPPKGVYYCGSDQVIFGRLQMEYLGRQMGGKGEIAILMGQLNHEATHEGTRGVKEIITSEYPNITIVAEQTANWMRNEAVSVVENWLTGFPNLAAIAANNDEMALGSLVAIESAGRKGILVAGYNGNPDALQAIKDGRLVCTVFQDAKGQAVAAADYITRALRGETLEPVNWIPFELITKENLDEWL
jgi:inositol transport system substrate-binding protein